MEYIWFQNRNILKKNTFNSVWSPTFGKGPVWPPPPSLLFFNLRITDLTSQIVDSVIKKKREREREGGGPKTKIRSYSSLTKSNTLTNKVTNYKSNLHPLFVTGLVDAEGSFTVSVLKSSLTKTGWGVNARFKITTHITDLDLMLNLKKFFGEDIGKLVIFKDTCTYRVDKLKDILDVVITHFDKYPLVTQKFPLSSFFYMILYIETKMEKEDWGCNFFFSFARV